MYTRGFLKGTTDRYAPMVEVSPNDRGLGLIIEAKPDPYLPVLATDNNNPAHGVVIPAGRIVALGYARSISSSYQVGLLGERYMPITLHDGLNNKPVGAATAPIFKQSSTFTTDQMMPIVKKNVTLEVPVVESVSFAHGAYRVGDKITGYYGTTADDIDTFLHRGKPVKWIAETVNVASSSASAVHNLATATYPGIKPIVIAAFAAGTLVTGLTAAYAFSSNWAITFSGAGATTVTEVWYTLGQKEDQIAGQVHQMLPLTEVKNRDRFLQYAEDNLNYPPAMRRRNVTTVAPTTETDPSDAETPSTVVSGVQYRVANYPMSLNDPVKVWVQGTVTAADGTQTTYSASDWYLLPASATQDYRGYFMGADYTIHWNTGMIYIAANIAVTAIRVAYSYITNPRDAAVLWGAGQMGLTDGDNLTAGQTYSGTAAVPANTAGIPAHLNYADVIGSARVFIN